MENFIFSLKTLTQQNYKIMEMSLNPRRRMNRTFYYNDYDDNSEDECNNKGNDD